MFRILLYIALLYPNYTFCINQPTIYKKKHDTKFVTIPLDIRREIYKNLILSRYNNVHTISEISMQEYSLLQECVHEIPYLSKIMSNRLEWNENSLQAGLNGSEPNHFRNIIEFEKNVFSKSITAEELGLKATPKEWTRHGLTVLLAAAIVRDFVIATTSRSTLDHTENGELSGACQTNLFKSSKLMQSAVLSYTNQDNFDNLVFDLMNLSYGSRQETIFNLACNCAFDKETPQHTSQSIMPAYRLAETNVWAFILDPNIGIFEQALKLSKNYLIDDADHIHQAGDNWFGSQSSLKAKTEYHFGRNKFSYKCEEDYLEQYQFINLLVENLKRIGLKIQELKNKRPLM